MTVRRKPLEASLGYRFREPSLLKLALTPPSAGLPSDNQRLEFLGDSILHFCASALVFREHPDWDEGALSKLRGMLVCTDALLEWAAELNLTLEKGPRSAKKPGLATARKPVADAMEAILAAIYLDSLAHLPDPLGPVRGVIEGRFLEQIRAAYPGIWESQDSKSTLQERAAQRGLPAPDYELLERSGPDHAPSFTVRVRVGTCEAMASAGSLKQAQIKAARQLLESSWLDK